MPSVIRWSRPGRRLRSSGLAALVGLLTLRTPALASGLADLDPFFAYERPAQYGVVSAPIQVPVRDGASIACQLLRPGTQGAPALGRFPGIIYNYTAYASAAATYAEEASYFVARGYNALVCQSRGAGTLTGVEDPFGLQEQNDNFDVIEWAAAQPWSSGKLGQMGVSYGAHTALLVTVNGPPALKAIIPINGISDWYENTIYRGGIYSERIKSWQKWVAPGTLTLYAANPKYNDFWRDHSVRARWNELSIPTLQINGWYDRYRDGMVQNYLARPDKVWLVSGPWVHGSTTQQFEGLAPGAYLAWWDHWLAGDFSAPLPVAKVTSYEIPGPGIGEGWQQYPTWPPPGTRTQTVFLTSTGTLSANPGTPDSISFAVNTEATEGSGGQRVLFLSDTLKNDLVLAGSIEAALRAEFSANDGNLAVVLYDLAADGAETRVTAGWRKASLSQNFTARQPLVPGTNYELSVPLWPTHYRFAKGHRIKIRISSDDYPEITADAPEGNVAVHVGVDGSSISFPVLRGGLPGLPLP